MGLVRDSTHSTPRYVAALLSALLAAGLGAPWTASAAEAAEATGADAALASEKGVDSDKGLVPLSVPRSRLDAAYKPRRIALLVGIGQFEDSEWRTLRYAEKDAGDLARVLRERGGFDQVETLSGGATRDAVRSALRRLGDLDRDERDTVVVYFSSHGTLARDARGALRRYLVTRDTRLTDVPGTGLAMDDLKAEFDALHSRRKVLVLATCHSGAGKSLLPADVQKEVDGTKAGFLVRPIEEVSRASVVLSACDWGETAREDETLANDIYTHYLVEALQLGVDRNADGAVTVSEAHDYARRMTYEYSGGRQRPSAESSVVGADPIVLAGTVNRRGKPELYSYAPNLDGFTLKVNGQAVADLPGGVAIDPGRHRIQLAKGGGAPLLDMPVRLDEGERLDVEALLRQRVRRWELAPRLGMMGFLDGKSRSEVLKPVPAAGATLTMRHWPSQRLTLRFDFTTGAGSSEFVSGDFVAPFRYSAFAGGVALPWRFGTPVKRLTLLAGPRLSAVYLQRRFTTPLAPGPQSYATMMPGVVTGASWDLPRGFTLGVDAQLDWMFIKVDTQNRSSGFGQLLFGAGYRF
jgi:hypothetical protein